MYRRAGMVSVMFMVAFCCLSCRAPDPNDDDAPSSASALERQSLDDNWLPADSGPWGTLEYRRFFLPLPKVWRENQPKKETVVWHVPQLTPAKLNELIATGPLTDTEKKLWLDTCRVETTTNGLAIYPSSEFRWVLQPESRALLYLWLSQFPQNEAQVFPFSFPGNISEKWFKDCNLTTELTQAIKHFLYPSGQAVCFADIDLLEDYLDTPQERAELLTVLHRQPYCELRLRVDHTTDLDRLSTYWGEWQGKERIKTKFKAALKGQPASYIPLARIIPTLPRSLLNTYPATPTDESLPKPDCYWTAFNFFNRIPDPRFSNAAFIEKSITKEYDRIEGDAKYGDIVLLVDASGRPMHAAVYLAADFVYTKNGGHPTKPWVIMKLTDMKAAYPFPKPPKETYYRWNPQKARPATS